MIGGGSRRYWSLPVAFGAAAGAALLVVPVLVVPVLAQSLFAQDAPPPAQAPAQVPAAGQPPAQPSSQPPSPPPSPPSGEAAADPASSPAFKPGFIDAFGRWLEDGASKLKSDMQDAQGKIDKLNSQARAAAKEAAKSVTDSAAKGANDAAIALPGPRAQTGRERCAPADNGAPDCQAAALALCRGKGFQTGNSLDTQSEQKCPAKVFLEGRTPNNTECPTTIFVTRAMCQ
jgi:hypothetical protein